MSRWRGSIQVPLVPRAIVAIMSMIAAFGFRGVFPDFTFVASAVIGGLGATLISIVTRAHRLNVPNSILTSLVGFAALGAIAAQGVPTLSAYETFGSGLINGWARVLSSIPPAELVGEYRVLPYTVAWASALIGGEILRSERTSGLAVTGPLVGLVLTTLISVEHRWVALGEGAALAAGALVLGWVQQQRTQRTESLDQLDELDELDDAPRRRGLSIARAVAALAMVVVATSTALFLGPRLPNAEANERFDLRQFQTPPFDPLDEPTPLGQVKVGLQEANADRVVLKVTSTEPIDRITLAVLDSYNSQFWLVADERTDAPAQFRPVDAAVPAPTDGTIDDWRRVQARIEVVELDQLAGGEFEPAWLPMHGWPVSITSDADLDLRFNAETGTVAVAPDGPSMGLVYDVVAAVPPPIEELDLASASVTVREPVDLAVPQIRSFAADVLEGADLGWEQVEAIRSRFVDLGTYDSREASTTARPGHYLGRLAEFLADPERLAGFEEQYAAASALLMRSEGLPARVVVGFLIPEDERAARTAGDTVSVLADDINAWVEVRFDGIGWLPFDVTPPRDREPLDTPVGRTERQVAVPNPPPDPPPPLLPPDLDQEPQVEEIDEPEETTVEGGGIPWRPIVVGGVATLPVVLLVGGMMLVVVLKRRRTIRRRQASDPSHRIAGAWYELMDRFTEHGTPPPRAATNREIARGLRDAEIVDEANGDLLVRLADDVDVAAFSPLPPDLDRAEQAWQRSEDVAASVSEGWSTARRWRYRLDPRPLFQADPLADERRQTGPPSSDQLPPPPMPPPPMPALPMPAPPMPAPPMQGGEE